MHDAPVVLSIKRKYDKVSTNRGDVRVGCTELHLVEKKGICICIFFFFFLIHKKEDSFMYLLLREADNTCPWFCGVFRSHLNYTYVYTCIEWHFVVLHVFI